MKRFTCETFLAFRFVSDPQLSPDGAYTAFIVKEADIKGNTYKSALYLYDHAAGESRRLSRISNVAAYAWEDAETIIFPGLRSEKAKKEGMGYYALNIHGGEAEEIFTLPVKGGKLNPLGNGLYALIAPYQNGEVNKNYERITEVPFIANGGGFTSGKILYVGQDYEDVKILKNGIYLYDAETGTNECLLKQGHYLVKGFELYRNKAVLNLTDGMSYGNGENGDFHSGIY